MLGTEGRIHPKYHKEMSLIDFRIKKVPPPKNAIIPLSQHLGAPAKTVVKVGDMVKVGTKIGEAEGFISANIHSSVSGKVTKIDKFPHPVKGYDTAIQIESDGKDEHEEFIKIRHDKDLAELSADDIRGIVKDCGVVGFGGATFPTHVKLSPLKDKPIDTVIINGAECEPFLTCDHALMMTRATGIIIGTELIMKAVGAKRAFIAVEENKLNALEMLGSKIFAMNLKSVKTFRIKTNYPQGAEKQLVKTVLKKEVPRGGLPMDVGVVVHNVGTALAIKEAVKLSKPVFERVVTVTGQCIAQPRNLLVRIGTPVRDLIAECKGFLRQPAKIISGGPMMGLAQPTIDVPVVKGMTGIVALPGKMLDLRESRPCIRCSRCVQDCPMYLMPTTIALASERVNFEMAEEFGALDCIECGNCSYVCPSKIPLVQLIKSAKLEITVRKRKKAAK